MNVTGFTREQKEALLNLLIVGMYADHNLAPSEDEPVTQLLDAIEFPSEHARSEFSDAVFLRAGRQASTTEGLRALVGEITGQFPTPELRQQAYEMLHGLLASDGRVSTEECHLLVIVKDIFALS